MANNYYQWPVSMPYDEIKIHDQSGVDNSETIDVTSTPKTPIAFIPFVSPKGYKDDDTLVFLTSDTIKKYGDPNYDKYGLPLYLARQFVDGGGNLLGMRVSASNSNHAHVCVVAEVKLISNKTLKEGTEDTNVCEYKVGTTFKQFSFKTAEKMTTTDGDIIITNKKETMKNKFKSFADSTNKEADLKMIYPDETDFDNYVVINKESEIPLEDGKLKLEVGKTYVIPLFIVYSVPYGENNYCFKLEPDKTMDTYAEASGSEARFYKIACYDGNDKLESVMSFTFEPFIYNNESMYVEDVFEDYSNNVGIIMSGDDNVNGCNILGKIMNYTFNTEGLSKPVLGDHEEYAEEIDDKDNSLDILFANTREGKSYERYSISDTNIFADTINLLNGSMGDFDAIDATTREDAIYKALTEAYNGTKSDLIYDEVRYPFEFMFQPVEPTKSDAAKALIDAMVALLSERESTTMAMYLPQSTTYTQSQGYKMQAEYSGYSSHDIYFWGEWAQIRDPFTHKRRMMPSVYFNAKAIPRLILEKGYGAPLAGSNFYWDGFIPNTVTPRTCKKDMYIENHNVRINTMNEDGTGKAMSYEQITAQNNITQLSEINNVISLRKLCSICYAVAREHRWSVIDGDNTDLATYAETVKNRVQAVMPNAFKNLNISAERESINGAGANRIHCKIEISYKNMLKGVTYDLYIL